VGVGRSLILLIGTGLVLGCSSGDDPKARSDGGVYGCEQRSEHFRSCQCDRPGLAFTKACRNEGQGPCFYYGSTCTDPDAVTCSSARWAEYPGLEDGCRALCDDVQPDEELVWMLCHGSEEG
jgi:hypothetical protein